MKNIILMAIAAVVFIGCQKQTQAPENLKKTNRITDNFSVKVQNGRLSFPSEKAYNNYLHSEGEKVINAKIKSSDFVSLIAARKNLEQKTSLRTTAKECEIPDELIKDNKRFFQLLNKSGIFEVGNYVFRYSYCDSGVWVITKRNFKNDQYRNKFMLGELTKNIIGFFPSNVDAFAVLNMGIISMPEKGSSEYQILRSNEDVTTMKAHARHYYEHFFINNEESGEVRLRGKLSYDKFAVYFNFYGKEKYQTNGAIGWTTSSTGDRDWKVDYYYRCRRKGKNYDYTGTATIQPPLSGKNKVIKTFYDGSRGLKNGEASWKVYNVLSTLRYIERKYGASWTPITPNTEYFFSDTTNNYIFPSTYPNGAPFGIGL